MEDNLITIQVEDQDGEQRSIEIPTDMNLSLMEALKASDYDIMATCGGMALCATCHVQILSDHALPEPENAELDMLDTLHNAELDSRLSCQIRVARELDGLSLRIIGAD